MCLPVQVQPPGFALHLLPYTDEVRLVSSTCPSLPPAVLPKVNVCRASESAVHAAGAFVDALTDRSASRFQFSGPKELYRDATIRAQVLGDDPPDRKDPEFHGVRRYMEAQAIPSSVKEAFLGQVGPSLARVWRCCQRVARLPTVLDSPLASCRSHPNCKQC